MTSYEIINIPTNVVAIHEIAQREIMIISKVKLSGTSRHNRIFYSPAKQEQLFCHAMQILYHYSFF